MARRRRRGGRRGLRVGKWVNLGFKVLAGAVAVSPAYRGVNAMVHGDFQQGSRLLVHDYTGIDTQTGGFDTSGLAQGAGAIIGAIVLTKIGGFLGRRF